MDKLIGALKSKTIYYSLFVSLVGVVEANTHHIQKLLLPLMGEKWAGITLIVVGAGISYFRLITKQPLDQKAIK